MPSEHRSFSFDASILQHQSHIPPQFIWPDDEKPCPEPPPRLDVPPIDLGGVLSGDPEAVSNAARLVDQACRKHGFFLVVNHDIDMKLVEEVHRGQISSSECHLRRRKEL
ncbi:UNVERIFIED_CONTAM: Gibberellin 20 oxidase 4 [Sesamum radiatum]|uniref:Gibberellin 20 oxidase 4 n=1 Tax=Sesamum radiatum TaxID=300843 RepID=A0AAW2KQB8_SESRA